MSQVTNEQLVEIVKILSRRVAVLESKVEKLQDFKGKKVSSGTYGPK